MFSSIDFEENKGSGYVRNFGIEKTRGFFLAFLDADDYFAPCVFEYLVNKMRKLPKTDVFVLSFSTSTAEGRVLKTYIASEPDKAIDETPLKLGMLGCKGFHAFTCVYMVKRTFVERYGICFAQGVYCEDVQFSVQLLFYAQKEVLSKKFVITTESIQIRLLESHLNKK